jgi:PKHD-type hydroxylase
MHYGIQKYNKILTQYCVINNVFNDEEVDRIIDLEDLQKFAKGKIGGSDSEGVILESTRDSDVMWINHDPSSDWLFSKFASLVSNVNGDFFMYNIHGFDMFQYTVYRKNEHYNWHIDMGHMSTNFERKISASIILTDPKKYDGGEFDLITNGNIEEPITLKPNKGDVVFFASWMPHRVRPVTSGVRKSLVCWVMGERTW